MERKKYDDAIKLFSEMLEREPETDMARSLLALAYYEKGMKDKAKELESQVQQLRAKKKSMG